MFLLLIFGCTTSEVGPVSQPVATAPSEITMHGLEAELKKGALLIDVRTPDEWKTGHVPGAVLATMPVSPDHPALVKNGKQKPVYLICQAGGRSGTVASELAKAGYTTVNVLGGTGAWRKAGKPTITP